MPIVARYGAESAMRAVSMRMATFHPREAASAMLACRAEKSYTPCVTSNCFHMPQMQ